VEPYPVVVDLFPLLYDAHRQTRRGKRERREVVRFELDLGANLLRLSDQLSRGVYRPKPYTRFTIFEPKRREVFAPRYGDRVVQQALADHVLKPTLEPRLIFDNAACRVGKGTDFALDRVTGFLRACFQRHGRDAFILKYDIRRYFVSIDHDVLKAKLWRVFTNPKQRRLLEVIVDSYEAADGVGLPLGNQASQWFALYYLDSLDRLIKERLRVPWYSRYMDDGVLIHPDKAYLRRCLAQMEEHVAGLGLEFNAKTQIFPVSAGVNYLGWHLYVTDTGKVVRRLDSAKKATLARHLGRMHEEHAAGEMSVDQLKQRLTSIGAHLERGNTWGLRRDLLHEHPWIRLRPSVSALSSFG
jgi:hypothetical protein